MCLGCSGTTTKKVVYPEKEIRIVVPWPPGGATDQLARLVASEAEKKIGKPVVVENKAGGGGAIGHTDGSKSKPDGYTITMMTTEASTAHLLKLSDFSYRDFEPIMLIATSPAAMAVAANAPYNTLNDLINDAKAKPGKIQIGSLAKGGIWNLAAVGVEKKSGASFNIVAYPGGAPAVTALLGGHIQGVSVGFSEALPFALDGKVKILGVASDKRQGAYDKAPTMKEQKIDLSMGAWWGLGVPKNTPAEIKDKIHSAFKEAVHSQKVQDMLKKSGFEFHYLGSADFAKWLEVMDGEFKKVVQ
jgi:tripartite-type tricarboxylate transporter receptor subunit TctC